MSKAMGEGEGKGYTIQEAADIIGVSSRQVRRYIKQGKLEAHLRAGKFGEEYRIPEIPQNLSKARVARKPLTDMSMGAERVPSAEPLDTNEFWVGGLPDNCAVDAGEPIDITSNRMALEIIRRLEEENRNLAGQLGIAQARVKQLEGELRQITEGQRAPWWKRFLRL